jgi:hypothetical protein
LPKHKKNKFPEASQAKALAARVREMQAEAGHRDDVGGARIVDEQTSAVPPYPRADEYEGLRGIAVAALIKKDYLDLALPIEEALDNAWDGVNPENVNWPITLRVGATCVTLFETREYTVSWAA